MSESNQDRLDRLVDAYLAYLEGDGPRPDLDELPASERQAARERLGMVGAMWGAKAPAAPAADPVARRFGFDRAGQDVPLDGRKVKKLRRAKSIELKDLARMVINGGGVADTNALFELEQSDVALVSQPTASALAAALGVPLSDFEGTMSVDRGVVRAFLHSPGFDAMVAGWAAEHGRDGDEVRRVVSDRVLALQYRAQEVAHEHLAEVVRTILAELEP